MKENNLRYFNFPIQLLGNFMIDSQTVLNDVLHYSCYKKYLYYLEDEGEDEITAMQSSLSFFRIQARDEENRIKYGKILFDSIEENSPMVGLNLTIFWDYYKNQKTEFQKVTLLGFLAIKSILQKKSYCKITNNFWLSRMDGKRKSISEISELSNAIRKYANTYQTRKIKSELERNWNLKQITGRGFYASFTMSIDDLTYQVMKKRKEYQNSQIKKEKDLAKKKAIQRLNETPP